MIELKLYERSQTALIVTPVQYYINWPVLSRFSPKEFMKTGRRTPRALLNPIVRITHKVVSPQTNHDHRLSCLNVTIIPPKRFIVIPISDQKSLVSSTPLPLMCHHKELSQICYPTTKTFAFRSSTGRIFLRLDLLWQNKIVFPLMMKIKPWKSSCGPNIRRSSETSSTEMFLSFEHSAPNEVLQHIWKTLTARKNAKKKESSCALINYWERRTGNVWLEMITCSSNAARSVRYDKEPDISPSGAT